MNDNAVIVTQHQGLVEFLIEEGVVDKTTPVLRRASKDDIKGKVVFGVLPVRLAAICDDYIGVEIPNVPLEKILLEKGMTAKELRDYGAHMVRYRVSASEYRKPNRMTNQQRLGRTDMQSLID